MPTVNPIVDEHGTQFHWDKFAEFCIFKNRVKEPSPHMQMIGPLTAGYPKEDVIWFSGLYAAFYNIPSALAMWYEFNWERAVNEPGNLLGWLADNWAGLTTRTERRTVRTPEKMAQCILSYIVWASEDLPKMLNIPKNADNDIAYDAIWLQADSRLRYMGRYIIIRLLEALHRFADLWPRLYDIRSIGGWSPKRALGLLHPDQLELLLSSDTKENIAKVDRLAFGTIDRIAKEYGYKMSPYIFAAMLCEYRVAYENRHQYPGWTIDQEPAYWNKIKPYWAFRNKELARWTEEKFYTTRLIFPKECLGEHNGWPGTRIEPRSTLRNFGYNWIDLDYDFNATKDFSKPVHR